MYVYILESDDNKHFYVGITNHIERRIVEHNSGKVTHTAKYRPWHIRTYTWFNEEKRAYAFETYLKSHSGRAFAKKHF